MSEDVSKETRTEEHKVRGENLVSKVKEIIHEGNVRRTDEEVLALAHDCAPLTDSTTLGVVGTLLLPAWAAVGAIAALVTNCSIVVEREEEPAGDGEVELEVEVEVEVEEE